MVEPILYIYRLALRFESAPGKIQRNLTITLRNIQAKITVRIRGCTESRFAICTDIDGKWNITRSGNLPAILSLPGQ